MSDFVVHTPEQLAAHDAATSKRYLEALRELQAENARLRAQVETCKEQFQFFVDSDPRKWAELSCPRTEFEDWVKRRAAATIAALGETN